MERKRTVFTALMALLMVSVALPLQTVRAQTMTINLSVDSGQIGTQVVVSGTLENPGAEFKIFWQYIKEWDGRYGFLKSGYAEGCNYSATIKVPSASAGNHIIIVEDEKNHATTYAVFTVTPEITVVPEKGSAGVNATVTGYLINNETIDIAFYDPSTGVETKVAEATTDAVTGEFSCDFKVPLAPEGDYTFRAYWNGSLQAEAPFHIGYQGIAVGPDKAPPNAIVTVSGSLAINETFTIAFRNSTWSIDVASVQTDESGQFAINGTVPEASSGDYLVVVYNDGVSASANFTILPPAQITASSDATNSSEALPGVSVVTVNEQNFIANEKVIIYFESTPMQVAEAIVSPYGNFTTSFTVPADASAGIHTITAVQDPYNVSASATITVHSVVVRQRATLYVPGDAISVYVNSTTPFNGDITVKIKDPAGITFTTHSVSSSDLEQVDGCWVAPYDKATIPLAIPSDAQVGIWTWNATFYVSLYPTTPLSVSGVIGVIPEPDLNYILQRLDQIEAKIDGIVYKQDELYLLITTNHNAVIAGLDQLEANLASITLNGFANIDTKLGTIQVSLAQLDAKISSVENGVVNIQTSLGMLTTDVATVKDMLAQMNAAVAEIKDGAATIQTGVGEIKANLAALNATVADIKDGVVTLQTAIGKLDAKLDALNASIAGLVTTAKGEVLAKIDTAIGTVVAKLDAVNATITGLITNAKGEVLATIDTAVGTVTAKLDDLSALLASVKAIITSLIVDSKGETLAKIEAGETTILARLDAINAMIVGVKGDVKEGFAQIETALGNIDVKLDEVKALIASSNANVTELIVNSKGDVMAKIETGNAEVLANLNALNASITSVQEGVAVVNTTIGELNASLKDLGASVTQLIIESENRTIVQMQTLLGPVNATLEDLHGKVESIDGSVANVLIPGLGELKLAVTAAENASERAASAASAVAIPIYAAIAISLVAAAFSAMIFIWLRHRTPS